MRIGIAFPTTEIGADPAVIRDFIETAEGAGYDHLTCLDHVVAPGTAQGPGEAAYYVRANTFHEPLSLFAFAAGLTRRIELATAVLVLPQRQTALVAKQAAEIDVLSGGRLRLGVGLGWLQPEYRALGAEFRTRARRFEEQVALLRRLWTEELVTFEGAFHRLDDVGLNPLPPRGTIPLWIGAFQIPAIERAGRVADGWFVNPRLAPGNEAGDLIATFREAAAGAGRDPAGLGIDATVHVGGKSDAAVAAEVEQWRAHGATHVTLRTMYAGFATPAGHIEAGRRLRPLLPPA